MQRSILAHAPPIAVVDDEALLPRVHERIALGAPHVDDLVGDRMARDEVKCDFFPGDQERGGAVAEIRLHRGARRRHARVRGDHQHAPRGARLHGVDRGAQRGRAGAQ